VSLWDEGEGDTFKADPPNAVLTWVDGDDVHEAEVSITDAEVVGFGNGQAIQYSVMFEAGDMFSGQIAAVSVFVDMGGPTYSG
jgi:hypothetical protein